ncbi:MAG: hypothetical protein HYV09_20800 [Deltaproteobacteria bacterium]|nr:hypothetical protein [Deltaproteobacteria bacterium]
MSTKPPSADDLLAGRAQPTASSLLRCIHEINPTARGLSRREEERRYALKARLQSLLVRHHADDLDVEVDARDRRLVVLRHRHLDVDACHAALEALDDDARSTIQRMLDLGPDEPPLSPDSSRGRRAAPSRQASSGPLDDAAAAIEAFDYEAARDLLERACAARPDDTRAAAMLIELLVDTLADDEGALAHTWSKEARRDGRVRARLAVATARKALGADDLDAAARAVRDIEPGVIDELLAGVREDLARRRGVLQRAEEASLLRDVSAENDASAALAAAQRVLARFPDSTEARRRARAASNAIVDREVEALRARAEAAHAEGDSGRALAAYREAASRAAQRPDAAAAHADLAERAREIERSMADAARASEIDRVVALLSSRPDVEGLMRHLALDDAARALVRVRAPSNILDRLEAMAGARSSPRARAEASLALDEALRISATDPHRAAALIAPHRAPLAGQLDAEAVFAAAAAAERTRRALVAEALVEEARALVAEGRADDAVRVLDRIEQTHLTSGDRTAASRRTVEALRAEVSRSVERARLRATLAGAVRDGRPATARSAIASLVELGSAAGDFDGERAALAERMARDFQVVDERGPAPLGALRPLEQAHLGDDPAFLAAAIGDDARPHVAHVEAHGRWIFIAIVDVLRREIVRRVRVRVPITMTVHSAAWDGRAMVVAGEGILALHLDPYGPGDATIDAWFDTSNAFGVGERLRLEKTLVAPDLRHVWVQLRDEGFREQTTVFDLSAERTVRELRGRTVQAMSGQPPRISSIVERGLVVHDARGVQLLRIEGSGFSEAAPLPSGRGLVLVRGSHEDLGPLELFIRRDANASGPRDAVAERVAVIEGSSATRMRVLATASDRVVLVYHDDDLAAHVAVFREEDEALVPVVRASAPGDAPPVVDRLGRWAFLWWPTSEGPSLVEASAAAFPPSVNGLSNSVIASLHNPLCLMHRDDPSLERVQRALLEGDASGAREALEQTAVFGRPPEERTHIEHLRALAGLLDDDPAEAEAVLARLGDAPRLHCVFGLEALGHLIAAMRGSPGANPTLVATLHALQVADEALARGDFAGALAALDARDVSARADLQALGRRVSAHLGLEDAERPPSFEAHRAAAALRATLDARELRSLPVAKATWPLSRIAAVAARAERWLR